MKIITRRFWQIFAFVAIAAIGYAIVSETFGAIAGSGDCSRQTPLLAIQQSHGTHGINTCCCQTVTGNLCCNQQIFCGYVIIGCNCALNAK